jgi:hypothetical protein
VARDKTHPNEAKPQADDARHGDWSQHQLKAMNDRFANAIAREQRQQPAPAPGGKETK